MRVAVLVTSCHAFHEITLPPLVLSLYAKGVPEQDIYVVVGDAPAAVTDGSYRFVTWHNMDNNGLIWAVSPEGRQALSGYEWVLYLHDTTTTTFDVDTLLDTAPTDAAVNAAQVCPWPSMSMGYYRTSALWHPDVSSFLLDSVNYDPGLRLQVKQHVEDSVFNRLKSVFGEDAVIVLNPRLIDVGTASKYASVRKVEYAVRPGIMKFKANWNVAPLKLEL